MNVHEYQAKEILARYGVPVAGGGVATSAEEARQIAEKIGGPVVVKAQIHAGGRGKGGGIKLAKNAAEASEIAHEYYLGLLVDRARSRLTIMASAEGGVEIEKVAAETPEKIIRAEIFPAAGFSPYVARPDQVKQFVALLAGCVRCFTEMDCSLVEINPLILTPEGKLFALDAKVNFDDNALFRHPDVREMRDIHEEDPLEVEASKSDLNYIKLEGGQVGCMVNGAGLAMSTMDIIQLAGGKPANFLDVGGGASKETVSKAFGILMRDEDVKAVLVNIFGGIVRCDRVAEGIIAAAKEVHIGVPLVVRLQGTNAREARQLLEASGLKLTVAETLDEAARKVVAAVGGAA
ncbi:MAG: ADP-forming succinate--CoA ligase subunit beta [Acidobacteria bacterium]|nr:ADP-forming succinate--CoA ligase subunit beta [Acidobacteriota bacterium]